MHAHMHAQGACLYCVCTDMGQTTNKARVEGESRAVQVRSVGCCRGAHVHRVGHGVEAAGLVVQQVGWHEGGSPHTAVHQGAVRVPLWLPSLCHWDRNRDRAPLQHPSISVSNHMIIRACHMS